MPGDENNPNLQPAGASAGTGENVIPPVSGIQQAGGEVPDPTLQAIGNLQTVYNTKGGPPAERGSGRGGAEHERFRMEAADAPPVRTPRIYLHPLLIQHRMTLPSLTLHRRKGSSPCWIDWNP